MQKLLLVFMILGQLIVCQNVGAQNKKYKKSSSKKLIKKVFKQFESGKYEDVIKTLTNLQKRIKKGTKKSKEIQGLIHYWRGMAQAKLNDFELAERSFIKALELKYISKDIYYEYGQVLYVASKYKRARIAFKKSVKRKYKIAVSLYYIAFISQELRDYKKAVSFYNMIEKLPREESKDVLQAARMQVGDIYLKQIERQSDPFKGVEKYVIPQYKKAIKFDASSKLAADIQEKIEKLQRKYELILFKMRNGKATARPPYYMRTNILYGMNDNVTNSSEDAKESLETKDYSSSYYQAGFFARYSFYPSSVFSYAPEFSTQITNYSSTSESILPSNKYFLKGAFKMNYEHSYKKRAATFYTDIDYTSNADDADADKKFAASDNTYGITFSEELQFWKYNPSTFRLRYESVAAEEDTATNSTITLSYEQVVLLKKVTIFLMNSYGMTTFAEVEAETSNTNTLTSRVDLIFPTFYKLFNPTIYASMTNTSYVEDDDRGTPSLTSFGFNLNRPVGKHLYLTMDYGINSQSADQDSDVYKSQLVTLNLDLIY